MDKTRHFNDWPNDAGFNVTYEELTPKELQVSGTIPRFCAGVLFRNGLGPLSLSTDQKGQTYRTNHWFDCLSQVHRFQIMAPTPDDPVVRVWHNSRRTCDVLIRDIVKTGRQSGFSFAAKYEPCKTFFKKLQTVFTPLPESPGSINIGVTLSPNLPGLTRTGQKQLGLPESKGIDSLFNKTDASTVQALDPETLEPLGIARQSVLHPDLKGRLSGAHAKVCPKTGDWYNYNLDFGRTPYYRIFTVSASTGEVNILAKIESTPAYIHASQLTDKYYILCVWNSHFAAAGLSILWNRNMCDAITDLDATKPAMWYVIDRRPASEGGRGLVATFKSEAFFCFHTINAYEEPSKTDSSQTDIVADLCAYDGVDVLKRFYIDNMRSDSAGAKAYSDPKYESAKGYFRRFRLPQVTAAAASPKTVREAISEGKGAKGLAPELPSINHAFRGRYYRYVYGVTDTGRATFFDGLVKYDVQKREVCAVWSQHGQTAGEPIFIADPDAGPDEEDGGVLLTAVLDGPAARSYLLVLDAKNLRELGRATLPEGPGGVVGFGFHGAHVTAEKAVLEGC